MKWIAGIDGGGSNTIGYAGDLNRQIIGQVRLGNACNYRVIGLDNFQRVIDRIITEFCCRYGLKKTDLLLISLGLAGADRQQDRDVLLACLQDMYNECQLIVNSDAYIALIAGLGKAEGIVLISGTGSIAYGLNKERQVIRAGGWGHIVSDEGSGYYIAREGLVRGIKSLEGREQPSVIIPAIMEHLHLVRFDDLISFIYHQTTSKKEIACLAQVIAATAEKGDKLAIDILKDAGNQLANLAVSVIDKGFAGVADVMVVTYGSILNHVHIVRERVATNLLGKAKVASGVAEPALGALTIGYERLGY